MNHRSLLLSASLACAVLGLAASADRASAQTQIRIDGSSTVFPVSEAMAEEFGKVRRDVRVTVGISGTGGGFKRFMAGEIDIADASRPIKQKEIDGCLASGVAFIEIPIGHDGLSVVVLRCGGDKRKQSGDIKKGVELWHEYGNRKKPDLRAKR